jgi:hypothetical protein
MWDFCWSEFLEKGDELFEYLKHHFHDMFDATDGSIKDFNMRFVSYTMSGYYDEVFEEHGRGIHDAILPWIHEEYRSGRLLNKEDWKPFRDQERVLGCYYGYRKLFMYDKYYLQLAMDNSPSVDNASCFEVALYGWREEGKDFLDCEYNTRIVPEDMRMPEDDWNDK